MAEPIDLGEDDGWVVLKIGTFEKRVDVFELNNRMVTHDERHRNAERADYDAALVRLFAEAGLPELSHRAAQRVYAAVSERVEGLKKKDAESAPSPGSTGSTPGG
jgi:hypothetical protein